MLSKKLRKFAFLVPACLGLVLMAGVRNHSDESASEVKWLATEGEVTVDKTDYDFGKILEDGGDVSVVYVITNNTKNTIVIQEAKPSCGCTVASFTKGPIEPGKTGKVTATYSPKGRPGPFNKTVTITTTGEPNPIRVSFRGTVE
ncbi:MAG: DUF1573 domain-containing protein [Dysgonamonadaceae bacterium]|jgi:hypothetical protein|nr:DUF1573 domain-containing protein [Dysgonamonadaceae bacterium]